MPRSPVTLAEVRRRQARHHAQVLARIHAASLPRPAASSAHSAPDKQKPPASCVAEGFTPAPLTPAGDHGGCYTDSTA